MCGENVPGGHVSHAYEPLPSFPPPGLNFPAMQAGGSGHCTPIHRTASVFSTDRDEHSILGTMYGRHFRITYILENHSSIIRSVTSAPRACGRGVGFVFVEKVSGRAER